MLTFCSEQCIYALFTDPQISFFINFFIKNGSHITIHTFKNHFATVFSVFSFQFQQNKFYPNTPKYNFSAVWKVRFTCFFSGAFLDGGSCEPVHCSWDLWVFFSVKFSLKMDLMIPFTHLKNNFVTVFKYFFLQNFH